MAYMRDSTGRRLDDFRVADAERAYSMKPGAKAVFLGDSITNRSNAGADRGWVDQLPRILGTAVLSDRSVEEGVPGERSDQMLARYATSVRANGAEVLFVLAGTNDAGQERTLAQFAAAIEGIVAEARRDGIPIIIGTTPPLGASRSSADRLRVAQYVAWLTSWAPRNGVVVADVHKALVTNGGDTMITGYDADGIHPNTLGHQRIAVAFANAFTAAFGSPAQHLVQSVTPFNLITNALFFTDFSTWFNPGGGTGNSPTNTVEADTTGKLIAGQWGKMALSGIGQASYARRSFAINGLTAGDKILITARTHTTDLVGGFEAAMQGDAPTAGLSVRATKANGTVIQDLNGPAAVLNPGPIARIVTVPAGDTGMYLTMQATVPVGQNIETRIGEVGAFNVTNLPDLLASALLLR